MRVQAVTKHISEITGFIAVPVEQVKKSEKETAPKTDYRDRVVQDFLADHKEFGKPNETQLLYAGNKKILLVGCGKKDKFGFDGLQNYAGTVAKTLLSKAKEITLSLPDIKDISVEETAEAVSIGTELAVHDPARDYKSEKQPAVQLNKVNVLVSSNNASKTRTGLKNGTTIGQAINLVRRLADMPSNEMTPTEFLSNARKVARTGRLKISVLNETQAKRKGMGAFVGVAQGSEEPSYMIALEYVGDRGSKEKWGFVGKGITFDTGGISIKPGEGMHEMKYDMAGAAAVLGTMQGVAQLRPKANVVGIMLVTENMPGGKSFKPGDILKSYSGKTAEIINTDAEGRVVLIDGLSWAQKDFKATKLVDLATLTGAMIIALGSIRSGVFGNNPRFTQDLVKKGAAVGEKYWEFPMDEEYNELVKSDFADIANVGHGPQMGTREAGSIAGAKFIEPVIEDKRPWVHLDIAGVSWDLKAKPYRGPGATGFGVKTLLELLS